MNSTDSWPQTHDQIILSKFTAPNQEVWEDNACIKKLAKWCSLCTKNSFNLADTHRQKCIQTDTRLVTIMSSYTSISKGGRAQEGRASTMQLLKQNTVVFIDAVLSRSIWVISAYSYC